MDVSARWDGWGDRLRGEPGPPDVARLVSLRPLAGFVRNGLWQAEVVASCEAPSAVLLRRWVAVVVAVLVLAPVLGWVPVAPAAAVARAGGGGFGV